MLTRSTFRYLLNCLTFALLIFADFPAHAGDRTAGSGSPRGVTVLLYHRFGDSRYPTTNVSVEALTLQMEFLQNEGYRVLQPRQFERIMDGDLPPGPKDVLITVDDGYSSFREHGFPVFEQFGFPVTVFVSTESIEKSYSDMLTWDEIVALHRQGVTFANHSHGHPHTGLRSPGESVEQYEERLTEDTLRARNLLKAHGIENDWYAYPYGEHTPKFDSLLRSLGYGRLFSQDPGVAAPGSAPDTLIPRMAIVGASLSMEDFTGSLARLPLDAELVTPRPGWIGPEIPAVRIRIPGLWNWGTGEVNVFLSEEGRLDAVINRNEGDVSISGPFRLERPLNRIIVTARDRATGRYRMRSWLLLQP